nr:MAG TPA: hypothetical protein [Caudoviricetes sp.]
MKWGMNIFGRRRTGSGGRFRRDKNADPKNVKIPKKLRKSVDERMREAEFLDMYRSRDNMSTKALKSKIARLEAERKFKELVEAPEKARREALQKKKQARLAFVGKAASAALDVYSKVPSSVVGNGKSGQAAKDAIEAFKKKQEWAKAFKDVPTTMTKFTQSINVGGVDVYIPETIQNRFMIQHAGRKGMKWGMHIFGDPNKRAFNKAVRGTRHVVKAFDKLQKHGRLRDNNILAESESINSVMTKGDVKYNPKIHNSTAMRDIKTIIRNNKILKDRTLGTDKDSIAIEKAANVLSYGSKGNKNSLGKLTSNSTDSKSGLKRESRRLFKEVNSLNKDHRKGRISDSDYSKQLKEAESRQQKNSKLRGYDTASYSGKGMDPARRSKYNKDGKISRALATTGLVGPSGGTAFAISRQVAISKGASFVGAQNAANTAVNAALPSALSTIGGVTTGVSLGIYGKRKYDEYNSQQGAGERLFKSSAPSRYRKDKIDPNVRKSIISTINNHEHTFYTIKDSSGKETMSSNIKRYSKPSWDFTGSGPAFSDGIVTNKWKKGAINHSGVNMGEIINGIYIPSNEDILQHYGKKGMKWKKKGEGAIGIGTVGAAPAFQDKAPERRAAIERLIAKEHEKAANKTKDSKKKEIRKKLRDKADKNSKELEKKRENMYNPYRGDKLPKKKVKHSDTSEVTLLHYGKKGMKWKKHLKNAANAVIDGVENAANWVDDQTFDKNRESALKDRSDSNKRKINDPKYGKTYNAASDPVDGKKNVDVKRALRAGRDNVVPSRTREGMKQENKYIEKIRKRVKLPRVK